MSRRTTRRWFRYRLRTLLAVLTLTAIGLGAFKAYVEPFESQRRAAQELAAVNASVEYRPAGPAWLRAMFGDKYFLNVVAVHLETCPVTADDLAALAGLPYVERLYLAKTGLTDDGLRHVASLGRLKRLSLWQTRITDEGLAHLAGLRDLEVLDIHNTRLTDAALEHLRGHPNLTRLIHSIPVSDASIDVLVSMPRLRLESLVCVKISDDGLRQVARLRTLESLVVRSSQVTDDGLTHLRRLKRLKSIELRDCAATDAGITVLASLPMLEALSIHNVPVTGDCLSALAESQSLTQFELSGTSVRFRQIAQHFGASAAWLRITADGMMQSGDRRRIAFKGSIHLDDVEHLSAYRTVETLVLDRPPFDLAQADCLRQFSHLQSLEANVTLNDSGASVLGRLSQLRRLSIDGRQAISPAGYRHLAGLQGLVELRLASCALTDGDLAFLSEMSGLEVLELPGNPITSAGMDHLRKLSKLRRLNVSFCPEIDDEALAKISALASLEDLAGQDTRVTDAGLIHLFDMPCLKNVTVLGATVTPRGLRALRGALLTKGGTIY